MARAISYWNTCNEFWIRIKIGKSARRELRRVQISCVLRVYLPLTIRPTAKSVCIVRWNRFVLWAVCHSRRRHWCRCRSQTCIRHCGFALPYFVWDNVTASTASIRPSPSADTLDRRISPPCPVWRVQHFHTESYPHSVWHYANAPYNAPFETIEQIENGQLGWLAQRTNRNIPS